MGLGVQRGNVPVTGFKLKVHLECHSMLPRMQVYRAGVDGNRMVAAAVCVLEKWLQRGETGSFRELQRAKDA